MNEVNTYGGLLTEREYHIKRFIELGEFIDPIPTVAELAVLQPKAKQISARFHFGCQPTQTTIDHCARIMQFKNKVD